MARTLEGGNRFLKRLEALRRKVRAALAAPLDKGASEIVADARRFAPVEEGDLRQSIRWRPGEHELVRIVEAGNEGTMVTGARVYFQNARLQEFGTQEMPANPFFFVAYRLNRRRIRRRLKAAARKAIKEG